MNKKQTVKDKNPKADERKKTVSDKTIPSGKIRATDKDEGELQFRKVLYGYDPEEVAAYIQELHDTYASAAKIHESKLSSLKDELVLSNRERTSCAEKAREIQAKASADLQAKDSRIAEYEATVQQLEETVEALKAEIVSLRSQPSPSPAVAKADNSSIQKIRELEEIIRQLQSENASLLEQTDSRGTLEDEYKSVLEQLEEVKARLEAREDELKRKAEELAEKAAKIIELSAENQKANKRIGELEIKNGVLTQSDSEKAEEIAALREASDTAAFRNAERISELESEHAQKILAMQKDIKMYTYYVERAELSVAELTKQIDMIKQALANSQP